MYFKNKAYLIDYFKYLISIALIFYVSSFGYAGISLVSIGLIIYAFSGRTPLRSYIAIFIVYLLVAGNPAIIISKPIMLALARYLSIAAIAFKSYSYFLNHPRREFIFNNVKGFLIPLIVFMVVAILASFLSMWYVHISILKATQFFIFVSSLLLFTQSIDSRVSQKVYIFCLSVLSFIILASLWQSLVNPSVVYYIDEWSPGQFVNTGLFCGIIYHPQSFGLVCAFTVAHVLVKFFEIKSLLVKFAALFLIVTSIYFITLTQSRTALFALIFLVFCAFIRNLFFLKSVDIALRRRALKNATTALFSLGFFSLVALAVAGPVIIEFLEGLLFKFSTYRLSFIDLFYSRREFILNSWEAFLKSPIFGEGFGVEKSAKFVESATMFTAPSEKCFIPTAILHELGIIGAVAFIYFLISVTTWAIQKKHINFIFLLYGFILINFGEYIFFSIGGAGCLGWLSLGSTLANNKL